MSLHYLPAASRLPSGLDGGASTLSGVEANILDDFLMVIAAGELRPGAFLSEELVADIHGVAPELIGRVFRALERLGLVSLSSAAGAQVEAIAPGEVPVILEHARTLTHHVVGRLAAEGLDPAGREAIARHVERQAEAEVARDWPRTVILGMEFLALLPRAAREKARVRAFDRHAMRMLLLRARYDLFGESIPPASVERLLLGLIDDRRPAEAARLVDEIYDAIIRHLWLDRDTESADLRKALARAKRRARAAAPSRPRLVAVNGQYLRD